MLWHKRYAEAAQPVAARRVLMTQSLGNMVACEALREGLAVGKYFMFDAAVPSEAIDATLRAEVPEDEPFPKYVPGDWQGYTNACWAANGHRLFADAPSDARGRMGWAGRFADALTNATEVFNYYSSGDDVFKEFATVPSRFDGLDLSVEMYCWQNDDDGDPYCWDESWDDFWQELPEGANTNAYCWIEIRPRWNAEIVFYGDGPSDLTDPWLWGKAGKTYRVWLLIGKTYDVECSRQVDVVGRSDARIEVSDIGPDSFTVVWPVVFEVGPGRAPESRPLLGATWNDGGSSFYVLPDPGTLGGEIVWYEGCCPVRGDGINFAYACDNSCTCEGCTVYGGYRYGGYELPVVGWPCGCTSVADSGPFDVRDFSFDKSAAIYEDPYTNMPGVVVHPTPSNVVLRCEVFGGTYGGRLTIALNEAGQRKIARVRGDPLPTGVQVPAGASRSFETEFTPMAPSDSVGDIVATMTFVEDFLNETHSATASVTSIRLQLEAIYDAPENHNLSRHVFGVGEKVRFLHKPEGVELGYHAVKWDVNDNIGYYDQFNGNIGESDKHRIYVCPISSNYRPRVRVLYGGAAYAPSLSLIEPQRIICRHVSWKRDLFQSGEVGPITLVTTNHIGPLTVSFCGIKVGEIPCSEVIQPIGYFATSNFVGELTHLSTAGYALRIKNEHGGNYWTIDEAGRMTPYANWSAGVLTWKIPIGWQRLMSDGDVIGTIEEPDYERIDDPSSRPLLIGGRTDAYLQIFTINELGFVTVEKFGHSASRSMFGDVYIDGRAVIWPQQQE